MSLMWLIFSAVAVAVVGWFIFYALVDNYLNDKGIEDRLFNLIAVTGVYIMALLASNIFVLIMIYEKL